MPSRPASGHGLAQTSLTGTAFTPGPTEASGLSPPPLFCRHLQEPPWPNPVLFMRRQGKQLLLFEPLQPRPSPRGESQRHPPSACSVGCKVDRPPPARGSCD